MPLENEYLKNKEEEKAIIEQELRNKEEEINEPNLGEWTVILNAINEMAGLKDLIRSKLPTFYDGESWTEFGNKYGSEYEKAYILAILPAFDATDNIG